MSSRTPEFDPTATQHMDLLAGYESLKNTPDDCPQCGEPIGLPGNPALRPRFCQYCRLPLFRVADKYQLVRKIGEGGGGVVYLARHLHFRKDAMRVIKFMRTEKGDDPSALRRFAREMEITASMSQQTEHIIRVYDDFGHTQGLGFFYVMEYLQGITLNDWLKQQKTPVRSSTAYKIIFQLAQALRIIHQAGIIHRDLKPENVYLIHREGNPYFVKLLDFGVAKSLESKGLTVTKQSLLGTPFYMTPEQFMGKPVDQRSDIYSLNLIFYELLAGHSPFYQSMQGGNPLMQAASAHLYHVPPEIQPQRPEHPVPKALEDLILRALSKDPEERPQSIDEMLADMHSVAKARSAKSGSRAPIQTEEGASSKKSGKSRLSKLRSQRFVAGLLNR